MAALPWLVWALWPWVVPSGSGDREPPIAESARHVASLATVVASWESDAVAIAGEPALSAAFAAGDDQALSAVLAANAIATRYANALIVDADYRVRAFARPTRWAGLRVPRAGDPLARALESSRVADGPALGPLAATAGLATLHIAAPLRQDGQRFGTLVLVAGNEQLGALLGGGGAPPDIIHELQVAIDGSWHRLEVDGNAGARLVRRPADAELDRLLLSASTGGQASGVVTDTNNTAISLVATSFAPLNAVAVVGRAALASAASSRAERRPLPWGPLLATTVLAVAAAGVLVRRRPVAAVPPAPRRRTRLEPNFSTAGLTDGAGQTASPARQALVAAISPELRAPLAAILGTAELAAPEATEPRLAVRVARIRESAETLLAYLDDLALLVGLEGGTAPPGHAPFRLRDVMAAVATRCAERVSEAGTELVFRRGAGVPDGLTGDGERLADILARLVDAVLPHVAPGRPLRVVVEAARAADGAAGELADQPRLLVTVRTGDALLAGEEPLADATPIDGHNGGIPSAATIGLVVAARAAESLGADALWVGNGDGPVFGFEVPAVAAPAGDVAAISLRGYRILVVDELGVCGDVLAELLARAGCEVHEAPTLAAASSEIRRSIPPRARPYDLLLVDDRVPDLDRLPELIAGRAEGRTLPPVVVVGNPGRVSIGGMLADARMARPVDEPVVLEVVAGLLGLRPPAPESDAVDAVDAVTAAAGPPLAGRRLLLVDDIEINREVGVELLQRAGAAVDTANDGRAAVEAIAAGRRYDAVLMDVEMPHLDGLEATREIRALANGAALPIIAWSAHVLAEDRTRCLAAGMSDYLVKPVAPERLYATVARWTEAAAARVAATPRALDPLLSHARPEATQLLPLDPSMALRNLGDDRVLYRRLLVTFSTEHARDDRSIRAALAAGRRAEAREAAHALKGLAATLGMAPLARVAGSIELNLRAGSAVPDGIVDALRYRLDEAVAAVGAWLGEAGSPVPSPRAPASIDREAHWVRLDSQIARGQLDALETFEELASSRVTDLDGDAWEEVRRALVELDFERAAMLRRHLA
jgi:CheY-like chemotaxis protein/HPt (histidine-containing phosphotransfer) domain-containing protein/signal transduction histidine kinase